MAQVANENDVLVRRLSDDFQQFKTSHHLPDDLESSKNQFSSVFFFFKYFLFFLIISDWCDKSSSKTSTRSHATKTKMAIIFPRTNDIKR